MAAAGFIPVEMPWPLHMDAAYLTQVRSCDWLVVDVSDPVGEALTAFLHGQFTPVLRIRHESQPAEASTIAELLYGALERGYSKDVTRWSSIGELRDRLQERLEAICHKPTLIGDHSEATRYFGSAAMRSEPVFLSYASEDRERATAFGDELRKRFSTVFDYREVDSIASGVPWRDEIAKRILEAKIGVILFSEDWERSSQ